MWSLFNKKTEIPSLFHTDIHSHLLPGIDDGVKSFEESLQVIQHFMDMGFQKCITTPHVMSDTYRNTPEIIQSTLSELQKRLISNKIEFTIEAAAEYYFDEVTMEMANQRDSFLSFGSQYVLFETNTFSEPMMLNDFIFRLKSKGYTPVMAHPERYQYLYNNIERVEDLIYRGVLMQVNILSLSGNYSKSIQKMANQLVEKSFVHFLGSDCHTLHHAQLIKEAIKSRFIHKALQLPLINYSL